MTTPMRQARRPGATASASSVVDAPADPQTLDPKLRTLVDDEQRPKNGLLFCAACSHVIGHVADRIEVDGTFEHTCTNPFGFVHRFGCHREAPGCAISGRRQAADSWFEGFSWRLAVCGSCNVHMGWLFENASRQFFGLILDRIQVD